MHIIARVIFLKRKKIYLCLIVAALSLAFVLVLFTAANESGKMIMAPVQKKQERVYIIDAGHGGEDGGAVGFGNTVEKELNLSIALKLNDIMHSLGFKTLLTRSEDVMTCDEGLKTQRQRKVSDIHNRLDLLEKTENAVLISIHQNSYQSNTSSGTQVFYSGNNDESLRLAETVQSTVINLLQNNNKRMVKKAGTSIYLLYYAKKPAVLVECGFITSPADCEKLKSDSYQNELAFAIACSVINFERNAGGM